MGVLANHVPSIEQLKPGLIEVFEESGSSKQFFRRFAQTLDAQGNKMGTVKDHGGPKLTSTCHVLQCPVVSPSSNPTPL